MKNTTLKVTLTSLLLLGGLGAYNLTTNAAANTPEDAPNLPNEESRIATLTDNPSELMIEVTKNEDGTFTIYGADEDNVQIFENIDDDGHPFTSFRMQADGEEFEDAIAIIGSSEHSSRLTSENFLSETMIEVIQNEDGTFTIHGADERDVFISESIDEDGLKIISIEVDSDENDAFNFLTTQK